MTRADIIVIGAGAAGLMAAMQLSKSGKKILVLEANDRIGGRIHTIYDNGLALEMGPEFIHGDLPISLRLLNDAGIGYRPSGGEMWRAQDGKLTHEDHFIKDWGLFEEHLRGLDEDMTINDFLDKYFGGEPFGELRTSVRQYAAGYDNADPARASAVALRKEWLEEEEGEQHKINGGYMVVINYLAGKVVEHGGSILKNTTVKEIRWQHDNVELITDIGAMYTASKCIVTIPLGVLQAGYDSKCGIRFVPELPAHTAALQSMGMGNVIKILFVFKEIFWKKDAITARAQGNMERMLFLFSDEQIPTWWTQYPDASPVLTGWVGGPNALALKEKDDAEITSLAMASLSGIFNLSVSEIEGMLEAVYINNCPADPYMLGSYSYATVQTKNALELLNVPVADTIYFAGEAYYTGVEMGTVEAALASGALTAEKIMNEVRL